MLEIEAIINSPGFVVVTWPDQSSQIVDGRQVCFVPHPDYNPIVQQFWKLCYRTSAYIDPYAVLPEDPVGSQEGTRLIHILKTVSDMEIATLNQLRRYFILCTRAERFSPGHIGGEFENGNIEAALRRLRELQ